MKYFLLNTDSACEHYPRLVEWFDEIDTRNINPAGFRRLPYRSLIRIQGHSETVFADIIGQPLFLVSDAVKAVLKLYVPKLRSRQVVLLDSYNDCAKLYHLPVFDRVDCLSPKSELSNDKSVIKRAVFRASALEDKLVFHISGMSSTYVAARVDVVESILRRPVVGIGLTPVETDTEEGSMPQ